MPALFPNRTGLQEHFTKQCVNSELIEKIGGPQVIASFTAAKRIWFLSMGVADLIFRDHLASLVCWSNFGLASVGLFQEFADFLLAPASP